MEDYMREFVSPQRLLMGPGPSNVHPRVTRAMADPILGHLDPDFLGLMDDVGVMLRASFRTSNPLTLAVPGTGTAGMEAAFCNVVERGDTVVVAINGYFGNRMADIASRCGAEVHTVDFDWGGPVGPDLTRVEDELKKHSNVKVLAVVHAETSTGVLTPIPALAQLAHRYGALLICDAVTSLGGEILDLDGWDVDICYSGTQKCLGAPPGLAPISMGPRAVEVLRQRKTKVQSFYLDLTHLESYWSERRVYHHTAPVSMIYSLREALRMLMEEGLDERVVRHARNGAALRAGLEAMGLRVFSDSEYRLNPLTAVLVPDGIEEAKVRARLRVEYNIEIGGGLGTLADRAWRVGLMGESSRERNVLAFLSALERTLAEQGYEVPSGAGVAAAQRSLASVD